MAAGKGVMSYACDAAFYGAGDPSRLTVGSCGPVFPGAGLMSVKIAFNRFAQTQARVIFLI